MNINLIVEMLVAGLLVVTIVYCFVLDRKLHALRSGQDGLRDVIHGLNQATDQAQRSVRELRERGAQVGQQLEGAISNGRTLADELSFLVETGDRVADRLADSAPATSPMPAAAAADSHEDIETAAARILREARTEDEDWSENVRDKIKTALGGVR